MKTTAINEMVEVKREVYLDNLKAILIFLVVTGHFVEQCINGSGMAKSIFLLIYAFHTPLFLFTNGLVCQRTLECKEKVIGRSLYFFFLYIMYKSVIFFIKLVFAREASFRLLTESGVP